MATIGFNKGHDFRLSFGGKTLYHSTSCKLDIQNKTQDIATKDTNGEVSIAGAYSWTVSTEALMANKPALSTQVDSFELVAAILNKTEYQVEFTTGVSGDKAYSGTVIVTNASVTAAEGSMVNGSFSFKGTGDLVESVNP